MHYRSNFRISICDSLLKQNENVAFLMVFSFLQRFHPLTRCIKKYCYNVEKYRKQILKKSMPVFTTYWEVLPDRYFFEFIFWALLFITKKKKIFITVLTLNANFLYYWPCSVSLRLLHKTMKILNTKLDNGTRRLFLNFIW